MYSPRIFKGGSVDELSRFVEEELREISNAIAALEVESLRLVERYSPPARPRDGMIVFADGTSWNPTGSGRGVFVFNRGSWMRL